MSSCRSTASHSGHHYWYNEAGNVRVCCYCHDRQMKRRGSDHWEPAMYAAARVAAEFIEHLRYAADEHVESY